MPSAFDRRARRRTEQLLLLLVIAGGSINTQQGVECWRPETEEAKY